MTNVTAIILSHNAEPYVGQAIESALAQTHRPSQIVVVDDSTDNSPAIVQRLADLNPNVVQLKRVEPCNVCQARNHGLDAATGDLIAFLDADDIWLPQKTELQLAALKSDDSAVGAYSPYFDFASTIDDMGRPVQKPGTDDPSLRDILFGQHVASSVSMFRRDLLGDLRFDEKATDAEDVVFAAELRLRGRWRKVDAPLIAKRIHPGQASRSAWHQVGNVRTRVQWVRRNREAIGQAEADAIDHDLGERFIQWLEDRYWRRLTTDLRKMCDAAAELFPQQYRHSFLATARFYPKWLYRVRDLIGR